MLIRKYRSRKLLSRILIIVCLFILFLTLFQFLALFRERKAEQENTVRLYMKSLEERLSSIDRLYYSVEQSLDPLMESILNEMLDTYESVGNIDFDLYPLQERDPYLDVFIIDASNVIVRSTDPIDIGLEMGANFMDRIRGTSEYVTNRVTFQTRTHDAKKYAYLSTTDGRYVFEVGYSLEGFADLLEEDSLETFSSTVLAQEKDILSLRLFNAFSKQSYNDDFNMREDGSSSELNAFNEARRTGELVSLVEDSGRFQINKLYKEYERMYSDYNYYNLVIELAYTNEPIITETLNQLAAQLAIIGLLMLLVLFFQIFINRNFLNPMNLFLKTLNRVSHGDFSVRLSIRSYYEEMNNAGANFNAMVSNIEFLLKEKEEHGIQLNKALEQNKKSYFETIRALVNAIDAKDGYTAGHCERVTKLCMMTADFIELDKKSQEILRYGSILHDIGKIGITDSVLNKNGCLTAEEYKMIQKHPAIGYKIIKDIDFLKEALDMIRYHHERWDGKGYPQGLVAEKIPFLTRIITIADAFDAMTSKRVYRAKRMTVREAFEEIERNSGTQFDPELLKKFIMAYQAFYGDEIDQKADRIEKEILEVMT